METKKLILIKLGGSVITDKSSPRTMRDDILKRLVEEIQEFRHESHDVKLIVGHGQGSFAHIPAKKYQTKMGFINDQSRYGMAVTQFWAGQTHQLVLQAMIDQQISAVSFRVASSAVANNSKTQSWSPESLFENLQNGLLPVTCGDVLPDSEKGCTIWSTETILEKIAESAPDFDFEVTKIIHVTDVDGVLDTDNKTIAKISKKNLPQVKKAIFDNNNPDVTGGMLHKIESCLALTKIGIESAIISGFVAKNLYNCLLGKNFIGTIIK